MEYFGVILLVLHLSELIQNCHLLLSRLRTAQRNLSKMYTIYIIDIINLNIYVLVLWFALIKFVHCDTCSDKWK